MKLKLIRDASEGGTTLGKLYIDDWFFCDTLEDEDRKLESGGVKIPAQTAIPRGIYKVIIDMSARFKKPMPHVLNVPQFEGIRIHSGNVKEDTEGCILVGTRAPGRVNNSRVTYDKLMLKLDGAYDVGSTITLEVI